VSRHARYRAFYRELLAFLAAEQSEDAFIARRALRWGYRQWLSGFGRPRGHVRPRVLR
jgi:hypothetical protein